MFKLYKKENEGLDIYDDFIEIQEDNERLEMKVKKLKAKLQNKRKKMEKLQNEIINLQEVSKQTKKANDKQLARLIKIEDGYHKLKKEKNDYSETLEKKQHKVDVLSNKVYQLEQALLAQETQKPIVESKEQRAEVEVNDKYELLVEGLATISKQLEKKNREIDVALSKEAAGEILVLAKVQAMDIILNAKAKEEKIMRQMKEKMDEQKQPLNKIDKTH